MSEPETFTKKDLESEWFIELGRTGEWLLETGMTEGDAAIWSSIAAHKARLAAIEEVLHESGLCEDVVLLKLRIEKLRANREWIAGKAADERSDAAIEAERAASDECGCPACQEEVQSE